MKSSTSRFVVTGLAICTCLLATGCVGMIARSTETQDLTFDGASTKAGAIQSGQCRVWMYVLGGGPNAWSTFGTADVITFNRTIYNIGGASFFYIDLPAGDYRVTTTGVHTGWSWKPGRIQKQVKCEAGQEYFIRIRSPSNSPAHGLTRWSVDDYPFELVERSEAVPQMTSLKYWKPSAARCAKTLND